MIMHVVAIALAYLVFQQAPEGTGSIKVIVTDSTGSNPIPGILVSVRRVKTADGNEDTPDGLMPKRTDSRGIALYDNVRPGKYLVTARLGNGYGSAFSAFTAVRPDSVSTVRISIDSHPSKFIPDENSSPKYRMPMLKPDPSREEKMPIYNPDMPLLRQRDSLQH